MTYRAVLCAALGLLVGSVRAEGQTADTFAASWRVASRSSKLWYLNGIAEGWTAGTSQMIVYYQDVRTTPRTARDRRADSLAVAKSDSAASWFHGGRRDAVLEIMDTLYADPTNACITYGTIAKAASWLLSGTPKANVENALASARKYSTC